MKTEYIELKVQVKIQYEDGYRENAIVEVSEVIETCYIKEVEYKAEIINALR